MTPVSHHGGRLRGFTLLEMIIVLAIFAVVTAVALPALFGPMGRDELRASALQVRAALLEARTRAIESGRIQEFRYERGGRKYEIRTSPAEEDEEAVATASAGDADAAVATIGELTQPALLEPVEEELPDGIAFADLQAETFADVTAEVQQPETAGADETLEETVSDVAWSAPVQFYPNGRCRNTWFRLRDAKSSAVDVLLRGLLGAALVGEPYHEENDFLSATQDATATDADSPPTDAAP